MLKITKDGQAQGRASKCWCHGTRRRLSTNWLRSA